MQLQQVAGCAAVQHITGVCHRGLMLWRGLDVCLGQAPARAQAQVQLGFIQDRRQPGLRRTNVCRATAFVGGQRPGAGELDQEQVILHKVGPERFLAQRALAHLTHEVMVYVAVPLWRGSCLEALEDIHAHLPSGYTASKKASSSATVRW